MLFFAADSRTEVVRARARARSNRKRRRIRRIVNQTRTGTNEQHSDRNKPGENSTRQRATRGSDGLHVTLARTSTEIVKATIHLVIQKKKHDSSHVSPAGLKETKVTAVIYETHDTREIPSHRKTQTSTYSTAPLLTAR